jgi:hypothetical protein
MRCLVAVLGLVLCFMREALGADTSVELNKQLAIVLADVAAKATSNSVVFKDGHLLIGKKVVDVAAVSEGSARPEGRFVEAARFEVRIDGVGKPGLTGGVVGVGQSRGEAVEAVVREWFMYFGQPMIQALSRAPTRLTEGRWSVYEGCMSIRGELRAGTWVDSSNAMHSRILGCISGSLPSFVADEVHGIVLQVVCEKGAATEGEARVDGAISGKVLQDLKKLDWPDGSYMFKQAYILAEKVTK